MAAAKKIPMRQCIGCGESFDKRTLIRIVKTDGDVLVLDSTGKLNGRGAYVCMKQECLEKAVRRKGLERAFKMNIPSDAYEQLREEMKKIES